jgi:hypothetical protein
MATRCSESARMARWTIFASVLMLSAACGSDDDMLPGFMPDASPVTGVVPPVDAGGGSAPIVDGGSTLPPVSSGQDAGVTPVQPMPTLDAQTQPVEAGTASDTGTVATGDATTPSGDGGAGDAGQRADLGKGNGKDVITIGDSWMLLIFSGIQESLKKASGQPYRTYGLAATQVLTGAIPGQFDSAVRADPNIKTVVMTGGGNDILLSGAGADCETGGPNCTAQLDKIAKALDTLWDKMSKAGVQDVVHVMYSAAAVKSNPVKNLPAHNERIRQMCQSHPPMRCFQLNTDALAVQLRADGIHPTDAEYDKIGKAAFDLMVKEGMRR